MKTAEDKPDRKGFRIRIDRVDYTVTEEKLSGEQLREVPSPPIPKDRDLYLVVPGHDDRKIKEDDTVRCATGCASSRRPTRSIRCAICERLAQVKLS